MAKTETLPQQIDILIVGAGLAGAATAYYLREFGGPSLCILEKEQVAGMHSSGRNAGMIRTAHIDKRLSAFTDAGARELRRGLLAEFQPSGGFILGHGGNEDASDYCSLAVGTGTMYQQDGLIDVDSLLQTYLQGQSVIYETELLSWQEEGEGILARTSRGDILCQILVNAAGPWAGQIGDLPLQPKNRHLFVTEVSDDVSADWPFVWDDANGIYFRPESGGLLMCACDESDAEPGDYRKHADLADKLAEKVALHQPGLGGFSIRQSWVGQRVFAPDRQFVIGPDPRCSKFFWIGGLGGHGVTVSPAIGRMAAQLLMGTHEGANPFDPARLLSLAANAEPKL